jgi:hypothetical protein
MTKIVNCNVPGDTFGYAGPVGGGRGSKRNSGGRVKMKRSTPAVRVMAAVMASVMTASIVLGGCEALTGPAGKDGINGLNGTNGTDGKDGKDGAKGEKGDPGDSAYEVAKKNGFVGNEAAWVASLTGKSAYEIAQSLGYKKSEDEWIASLKGEKGETGQAGEKGQDGANGNDGSNGTDGANGKSAYEVAVKNGFKEDEAAWLETLVGANGNDGADGKDGKSAYEIAQELDYGGTEAEWIASLKGADGKDGEKGIDGKPAAVMHPLWLGNFPVILEDQTGQLSSERVDWVQDALKWFNGLGEPYVTAVSNLTNRSNSNIRIIINNFEDPNYRVINYRSCELRAAFVSAPETTYAQLRQAVVLALTAVSHESVALFKANGMPHLAMGDNMLRPANKSEIEAFARQAAVQVSQGNKAQRLALERAMGRQLG